MFTNPIDYSSPNNPTVHQVMRINLALNPIEITDVSCLNSVKSPFSYAFLGRLIVHALHSTPAWHEALGVHTKVGRSEVISRWISVEIDWRHR